MGFYRGTFVKYALLCFYLLLSWLIGILWLNSIDGKEADKDVPITYRDENSIFHNTSTSRSYPHKNSAVLVKIPNHEIYLYTALLSNSSSEKTWDRLAITGWEHKEARKRQLNCCVKFKSGLIRQASTVTRVRNVQYVATLSPLQYVCNLTGINKLSESLISATICIQLGRNETEDECPTEDSSYIPIEYVYSHPTQIAALSKIIYGNVSLPDLVAWLEIHKSLGMDKVVFYSYRLGHNVSKVLQYYQTRNLVQVIPVSFPNPDYKTADDSPIGNFALSYILVYKTANFSSIILTFDYWVDEEIALVDGQERLRGYKYVVVFDIDEYIVPSGQRTWINLTEELSRSQPKAAGFKFYTNLYTTSWGVSSKTSLLQIGRYLHRTGRTQDRPKYLFIPSRVAEAALHPHYFVFKSGFNIPLVTEKMAVLSHYRSCRERYDLIGTKCFEFQRHFDDTIYKRFQYMEDRAQNLLTEILN